MRARRRKGFGGASIAPTKVRALRCAGHNSCRYRMTVKSYDWTRIVNVLIGVFVFVESLR